MSRHWLPPAALSPRCPFSGSANLVAQDNRTGSSQLLGGSEGNVPGPSLGSWWGPAALGIPCKLPSSKDIRRWTGETLPRHGLALTGFCGQRPYFRISSDSWVQRLEVQLVFRGVSTEPATFPFSDPRPPPSLLPVEYFSPCLWLSPHLVPLCLI